MTESKIKRGEYWKRLEQLRMAYHRSTLDAAVATFPVGELLTPPYIEGPRFDTCFIVTGHKQSYDGTISVWVKKLDKLGRPNGKAIEMDPLRLDHCFRGRL